jgi:hypothetical protein
MVLLVVYNMKNFNIYRVGNGHIVHNTRLNFDEGHTHIKSFKYAKQLIHNTLYKKRPKTKNLYLLESHKRVSDDLKYTELIEQLMDSRREARKYYINVNKGTLKK